LGTYPVSCAPMPSISCISFLVAPARRRSAGNRTGTTCRLNRYRIRMMRVEAIQVTPEEVITFLVDRPT